MDSFFYLPYLTYFLSFFHISICVIAINPSHHRQAYSNIRKSQYKRVSAAKNPAQNCFKHSLPFFLKAVRLARFVSEFLLLVSGGGIRLPLLVISDIRLV
jgi:hypothetical protein